MGVKIPPSGTTKGGSVGLPVAPTKTTFHVTTSGYADRVAMMCVNNTGATRTVTVEISGSTFDYDIPGLKFRLFVFSIAEDKSIQLSSDATGVLAVGAVERERGTD